MAKVTGRQELFAQGLAAGMTGADAYRAAYNADHMKKETVANKAYVLAKRDDIQAIVAQKRKELARKEIWTREQALRMLADIAIKAKENTQELGRYNAAAQGIAIKAIEQANKMCGYNEPVKLEHGGALRIELCGDLDAWAE